VRIAKALRDLGFGKIQELPLYRWVSIGKDFRVLCGSVGSMDSFLAVRADGESVLNINDCFCTPAQIKYIQRRVGKLSLLFAQFSLANWIRNRADETNAVQSQLELLTTQIAAFQLEFTIPFASFVYFCNEENAWMNDFMVKPRRVEAMNLPGVHFMYPGDAWTSEERSFRSQEAVERYMADLEKLTLDSTPPGVGEDKIKAAVLQLLAALQEKFGKAVLRRLSRFEVYVHDLKRVAAIDPGGQSCEFRDANAENAVSARYTMCSQVLWYTFAHTWGWGTTAVSGMYLDREFKNKSEDKLLNRAINAL
jgi:hypothetical protein